MVRARPLPRGFGNVWDHWKSRGPSFPPVVYRRLDPLIHCVLARSAPLHVLNNRPSPVVHAGARLTNSLEHLDDVVLVIGRLIYFDFEFDQRGGTIACKASGDAPAYFVCCWIRSPCELKWVLLTFDSNLLRVPLGVDERLGA